MDSQEVSRFAAPAPVSSAGCGEQRCAAVPATSCLEDLELELLLEAIYHRYGYDFREYARASLKRRVWNVVRSEGLNTLSGLQEKLLHEPACMERFLVALSVNVTSLFRDPRFYLAFRTDVAPLLRTYPFLRIWHAGCSTGEEVYSMAILLQEEGLYERCRIYATDLNESIVKRARDGIFPLTLAEEYAENHRQAGGKSALSDYFTAAYGSAIFRAALKENILFSRHNLAVDRSFNQFNVIFCRNVLIYFAKSLQRRVHGLLYESLAQLGILALGSQETLQFTPHEQDFEPLACGWKLYRKTGSRLSALGPRPDKGKAWPSGEAV
jgi:chemotaxis protein methyltransferase CheR